MKRMILFINKISKYAPSYMEYIDFEIGPSECAVIKTAFSLSNINYLEKELMRSSDNEFQKNHRREFEGNCDIFRNPSRRMLIISILIFVSNH